MALSPSVSLRSGGKDGNGYVQQAYTIWPMYEGEAPQGIGGINHFEIVIVNPWFSKYVTTYGTSTGGAFGTNLDGNRLLVYLGADDLSIAADKSRYCSLLIGPAGLWLARNSGKDGVTWVVADSQLSDLLHKGGLCVRK